VTSARKRFSRLGAVVMTLAVMLAGVTVYVGVQKTPNPLAASLLQAITLVFTVAGAYIFGTASASVAAEEMIRPHVRSAFRRQRNLYMGLGRLESEINLQMSLQSDVTARLQMAVFRSMITEMINTADDALEDWRDIVPEDVKQIEDEALRRRRTEEL
jgi:hypothetical protein